MTDTLNKYLKFKVFILRLSILMKNDKYPDMTSTSVPTLTFARARAGDPFGARNLDLAGPSHWDGERRGDILLRMLCYK